MEKEKKNILELKAKHPMSNLQIIERFIDGVRFMKVTPKSMMPLILEKVKKMFDENSVSFEVSDMGWVRIEKKKRDEKAEEALRKSNIELPEELNERDIFEKEASMLKQQGFEVKIRELEI